MLQLAAASKPVFNRLRHSVNGEPRCSGCKTLLSSWARLQKRIEHGACPTPIGEPNFVSPTTATAVPPEKAQKTEPAIPASADTASAEPLVLQSDVLSIIQQHGWRKLVSDLQRRPKLAQWCCLCGTWCASNRAVKMHLARSHRTVWNMRKHRIEKLCKSQGADIRSPCDLCGSTSKDPKSHVVACPVIFQPILFSLVSANGSRSGARLFQALASGGEPATADWVGADGDEGPKQESKDGDQPQPQGPGQGPQTASQPGTQRWAASGPRPSEVGRAHGKAHPEVGGRTAGSSSGLWLYMVRQHGAGRHTSHDVRRELGVEKTAGDQPAPDHKPAADPHDELHSGRAGCEDAENSGGGGHAKVGAPAGARKRAHGFTSTGTQSRRTW